LDGEALLHAVEAVGDLLQLFQALDVVFQALAAGAGAGSGDSVGGLHQHGFHGLRLHVVVVGQDGVDNVGALVILAGQFATQGHVGALSLVVHSLADVVQEACALG